MESLKKALTESPVLQLYCRDREMELHTGTSIDGWRVIIIQHCAIDGKMHPVYYVSRKTTDALRNYHSFELEAVAVVLAVERFTVYLHGIKFKIMTDCKAFKQTLCSKELKRRTARWVMFLEMFEYTVNHRSAERMRHVDALSIKYSVLNVRNLITLRLKRTQKEYPELKAIRVNLQCENAYEN